MLIRSWDSDVLVWAPAKVNLFLEVLARRPDGYHELETLMVTVNLYDSLEFQEEASGVIELHCDPPSLSCGPDNLIRRAAELLRDRYWQSVGERGVRIRLRKRIPLAAGLAGGSSDAAATLAGLNRLWRLGLSRAALAELGAELGSDVSFFFYPPAAWCTGRGERVQPLGLIPARYFVLVCPGVGLSTAEVFRNLRVPEQPLSGQGIRAALERGDGEDLGRRLHNRLEPVAQSLCPAVAAARERLLALRPAGALMSGSGTTVFALCRDAAEASRLARGLSSIREEWPGSRVCIVRSCD